MDLTKRQKRFLKAFYRFQEPGQPDVVAVVDIESVAELLGMARADGLDVANVLAREHGLLVMTDAFSYTEVPLYRAEMTDKGRDYARQLIEDELVERKGRIWAATKVTWAVLLSIAVPVSVAWLNRRVERLEGKPAATTTIPAPSTTQPTTRP